MNQDTLSKQSGADLDAEFIIQNTGALLIESQGYRKCSAEEAVKYYLMKTYLWSPLVLDAMSESQLAFCIWQEHQSCRFLGRR